MKTGDLMRVRRDIDPHLPWATPGSIVEVQHSDTAGSLIEAVIIFGSYRDPSREEFQHNYGCLVFHPEELEPLEDTHEHSTAPEVPQE